MGGSPVVLVVGDLPDIRALAPAPTPPTEPAPSATEPAPLPVPPGPSPAPPAPSSAPPAPSPASPAPSPAPPAPSPAPPAPSLPTHAWPFATLAAFLGADPAVPDDGAHLLAGTPVAVRTGEEAVQLVRRSANRTSGRPSEPGDGDGAVAAVITAPMLPDMPGAALLAELHRIEPGLPVLIAATVEELDGLRDLAAGPGREEVFAILVRPVPPLVLDTAVRAALRHRAAVTAEDDLMRHTLAGAMDVLVETLAVASPIAYRRTNRVRLLTDTVTVRLGLQDDWRLPVAAMVSQIGCFAVPPSVLSKVEDTVRLSSIERQMYVGSLVLSSHLLGQIPRLAEVSDWVGAQVLDVGQLEPGPVQELPRACFDAVTAFLAGYDAGLAPGEITRTLNASGRYPADLVETVRDAATVLTPKGTPETVPVDRIRVGMVLNENVTTDAGLLLMRRGERVTAVVEQRLRNFARTVGVAEPIAVLLPGKPPPRPRKQAPRPTPPTMRKSSLR